MLLVLIAVIPVFLVVILSSLAERRGRIERASATMEALADLGAAHQEQLIEGARQMLVAVARSPAVYGEDASECAAYFSDLHRQYLTYTSFGLLDVRGNQVCAGSASPPVNSSDRYFFRQAVASGGFTIGEYLVGRRSGKSAIVFSMPVVRRDGSLRGVLFAALDLRQADSQLDRMTIPPDSSLLVTDAQGVLLASAGSAPGTLGQKLGDSAVLQAILARQPAVWRSDDSSNRQWIHALKPVRQVGAQGIFVTAMVASDDVLAGAAQRLQWQLGALTLIALASALCAWIFGERVLARPIKSLIGKVQALQRGELALGLQTSSGLRELATLHRGFEEMARSLASRAVQRDRAMAELEAQKKLLESILDSLGEGVLVSDTKGHYLHLNSTALRIMPGLIQMDSQPEPLTVSTQAYGLLNLDGVTPLRPDERPPARALAGENVENMRYVMRGILTDGVEKVMQASARPLRDQHGRIIGSVSAVSDVTIVHKAEQTVREAHEFARQVIAGAREGIVVYDRDLRVMVFNPFMEELTGQKANDLLGGLLQNLVPPARFAVIAPRLKRALAGEIVLSEDEPISPVTDRWISSKASPVRDPSGAISGVIVVINDVTARVQAQRALERMNETLEHRVADRTRELALANKELESFSYSVSHDLRSPLHVIDGFGRALMTAHSHRLDAKGLHYLERIQSSTRQMGHLIDDLLSLAKVSRTEIRREAVDLGSGAWLLIEQLRSRHPQRQVRVEVEEGLLAIGDPRLLMVVLHNLIENAWKFTEKTEGAQIQVGRGAQSDGQDCWFVRDNGAGFDMAHADKLFEAFQRLHGMEEFDGTGIGLATVHRIIMRHGGRIWAEARPGQGATFWFTLGAAA